jgi:ribosomal protein S12
LKKKTVQKKQTPPLEKKGPRKEPSRRFLFVWAPIIIIVLLLFYGFVFDPPRPVGSALTGVIGATREPQSRESIRKICPVDLEDGRAVLADCSGTGFLQKGRKVLVQETRTLIFKRRDYSIVFTLDDK